MALTSTGIPRSSEGRQRSGIIRSGARSAPSFAPRGINGYDTFFFIQCHLLFFYLPPSTRLLLFKATRSFDSCILYYFLHWRCSLMMAYEAHARYYLISNGVESTL